MRFRHGSVLEALRRIQAFCEANDDLLGELNRSGARRRLDESITELSTHAADQQAGFTGSTGDTARQYALRKVLRDTHMRPIAVTARALLREVPELVALRLPHARSTTERLLAAAGAMGEAAGLHAAIFVDAGLREDFVARLTAAADELRRCIDSRGQYRGRRAGATSGLQMLDTRARHLIRILDALIVPALGTNASLIAEWHWVKHIAVKPGPARGSLVAEPAPDIALTIQAA